MLKQEQLIQLDLRNYRYNVDFNDVNYTLTLAYDTKSNNIEINTYTDFEKYNYTSQMYQIPDKYEMESIKRI